MSSSRNLARILLPSHCARAFNNSTLPPSLPAIIRFSSSHPEYILRNGNRRQIATANFQFRPNPNNNNVEFHARYSRTLASTTNNGGGIPDDATISNEDMDTYAVAILKPNLNSSAKLSLKNLRIEQILKEAPGMYVHYYLFFGTLDYQQGVKGSTLVKIDAENSHLFL